MKTCYICKEPILDNEPFATAQIDVGGPNDGCGEYAEELHDVYMHLHCCGVVEWERVWSVSGL